ncbi:MAG: OFA family MFS transporter [Clostridiaceae bacterium]|nr:OFA family MFS transporter [Clostridiaceae bacterium]
MQDRIEPRKIATIGSIIFFVGYALAGMMHWFRNPGWLIFTFGLIVGTACGLTYACVAPTARKWYPDRPGFAVSISVMGFGLSAVVFAPLTPKMIDLWDVNGTFWVLSIFVGLLSLIGARLIKNPPETYAPSPDKTDSEADAVKNTVRVVDIPPTKFIRMPTFYLLWLALAMVIGGGLTAIGLIPAYGEIELGLMPAAAAIAVSVYSLVNGLGRPLVGLIADRIGSFPLMILIYIIQAITFFALPFIAVNLPLLILCAILLGIGYATTFALFPVLVADGFGTKYLGINYGLVFSAFGMGAVTNIIGAGMLDSTGSFTPAFLLAGGTSTIGLLLILILQKKMQT